MADLKDRERAEATIERHEGRRKRVYKDQNGNPTIGIGFNLRRADAAKKMYDLGHKYGRIINGQEELTDSEIDLLFAQDLDSAIVSAGRLVGNFGDLTADRQTVVVDMVYNLGEHKFSEFRETIAAIEREDFEEAAAQMESSLWYDQVKPRAEDDVEVMRGGRSFGGFGGFGEHPIGEASIEGYDPSGHIAWSHCPSTTDATNIRLHARRLGRTTAITEQDSGLKELQIRKVENELEDRSPPQQTQG